MNFPERRGKTVMTTEPKFIPKEAVQITLGDGIQAKVRLIDCVGYMVDGLQAMWKMGKSGW